MATTVPVSAARIPDRDRLLAELLEAGLTAKPVGEVEIHVTCPDGRCDDALLRWAEELVMQVGDAFVPIKHDGVIYIRPPVG
ncbi:MAG TPA: hypothetical protein VGL76_07870 [Gaiellaceae bacterium]|jgi:hypothetical protein